MTRFLIGTTKGLFLLDEAGGGGWQVSGPHCAGWGINHAVGEGDRLWAGGGGSFFGAGVWRSDDGGESWQLSRLSPGELDAFAEEAPDFARSVGWTPEAPPFAAEEAEAVWSLAWAHRRLWCGVKPGRLYVSDDGGESWAPVAGLNDHPTRADWGPGAAGLTLHTFLPDPEDPTRFWLAMSAAGVFASEDGGETWERRNRLANADACTGHDHPAAPRDGQTGLCVHNMQAAGGMLWQQNHHGVFRSADGGRSWSDVTGGLPSTFGFPIGVDPGDPDTAWTVPLNGDTEGRFPPGAAAAVWRTRDGGATWEACRAGLPQQGCYFTVLRQAMSVAPGAVPRIAFGTNSGSVFLSDDRGDSWQEIARHLPTVLSVEAVRPA